MCGIAGFLTGRPGSSAELENDAAAMAEAIRHRGPDDSGVWADAAAGVALAHRRLSVLDLSPQGRQPMLSGDGRFVIVFNGEIYNYRELRRELDDIGSPATLRAQGTEARRWRGHSDTEVMLAAFDRWGVEAALSRFNGMFAFALWDRQEQALLLARDRLGEKPLYYGWCGEVLLFGSELKALRAHRDWRAEIDRDALALYLRYNYVPRPHTIYRGISKLPPGHFLKVPRPAALGGRGGAPQCYWSARRIAEQGRRNPIGLSDADLVQEADLRLRRAVRLRMEADVPLGAFLSGGVDSSLVVALMQAQSGRPVKTFTVGFQEDRYNEAHHAAMVARHIGTEHTEEYVSAAQAMAVIPRLPDLFDEPFSDSSQIPTFLIAQVARQHVTVSLSGDGGDESFGGYNRYFLGRRLWSLLSAVPRPMRRVLARVLQSVSPERWGTLYGALAPLLPGFLNLQHPGDKLQQAAQLLAVGSPDEMYLQLVSHWKEPGALVPGCNEPATVLSDRNQWAELEDFTERMMYLDTVTYLPDDIMVKLDRATMGVSLEGRVPLLDHELVEFAWRLPLQAKIRDGVGKWLLRQVLRRYVPDALIDRPKMGFTVPLGDWLRGPLQDWAEDLLAESRLKTDGFLEPGPIREKWRQHLAGREGWQYCLWNVLMFQQWLAHTPHRATVS